MALKEKLLVLYVILHFVYVEGISGTNYQDEVNMINEDDRRAAGSKIQSGTDLHASSSSHGKSNYYLPPAHDSGSLGHTGPSGYAHLPSYPHSYNYQPSQYDYGHAYGGYDGDHGLTHHSGHSNHHESGHSKGGLFSALALKGILIPLAGIALLGAAAALSANPVLLQLGVLNGRRKRSLQTDDIYPVNPNLRPTESRKNRNKHYYIQ